MFRDALQESMSGSRRRFAEVLHGGGDGERPDPSRVWAGGLAVEIDGRWRPAGLNRLFLGTESGAARTIRVRCELFVQGATDRPDATDRDIDARLWCDFNDRGYEDERGFFFPALPFYRPMKLRIDGKTGRPVRNGNNLTFVTDPIDIHQTGTFNFTVLFAADDRPAADPAKRWLAINDLADNRDGVLVVSPDEVKNCPSVTEVCVRKCGARIENGEFVSGTIRNVTDDLERIHTDIVYLLPFFEPGFGDLLTGEDVRKGDLGSPYAVKDFFRIDPRLVGDLPESDFAELVTLGLVRGEDLNDLLDGRTHAQFRSPGALAEQARAGRLRKSVGEDAYLQMAGRAEMRWLVKKAHALGKKVIFDLVLMQTSRDCLLVREKKEWYCLDENGAPKRHRIAWLDYSDVALFDLKFNKPLQNYLGGVAPHWIQACDFDGVRIDASQTVDRPFLKLIKNRIQRVKPDAVVLCETLCAWEEAVDVPGDMIYSLMVDHHIHVREAGRFYDLLEGMSAAFAPGTVGIAYFENHDSERATLAWHRAAFEEMQRDPSLADGWRKRLSKVLSAAAKIDPWDLAYGPSLLKNIQASVINAAAGCPEGMNLAYALEMGTDYGEEARVDFETASVLYPENRDKPHHSSLREAYGELDRLVRTHPGLKTGRRHFLRGGDVAGADDDRVMAWTKEGEREFFLVLCNLDFGRSFSVSLNLERLQTTAGSLEGIVKIFDSYEWIAGRPGLKHSGPSRGTYWRTAEIGPLCSAVFMAPKIEF